MKRLAILPILFLLSACLGDQQIITVTYYPELPDLSPCTLGSFRVPEVDYPRKMDAESFERNLSTCKTTDPKIKMTAVWMENCLEKPIDPNSNLFVGFDQKNWTELNFNLIQIQENYRACQSRIDEVNKERADWRERNKAARETQKLTDKP